VRVGEVDTMNLTPAVQANVAVRVTFMGGLHAVTGQRELQMTFPQGATVADLLASLSKRYGDAFTCRVFSSPGKLEHTILIFVDGEHIKGRGGLAATLGNSEVEVIMLPMYAGG